MISEKDFAVASVDSPEMAFVRLERRFRAAYEANLENSGGNAYDHYTVEYINHTVAAAKALGLDLCRELEMLEVGKPTRDADERPAQYAISSANELYARYRTFRQMVDHYAVQIQIAHVRASPPPNSRVRSLASRIWAAVGAARDKVMSYWLSARLSGR